MILPSRAALPILVLMLAPPAVGQSSLGQPGTLPPPRAAATGPPPATPPAAAAPRAAAPATQAPAPRRPAPPAPPKPQTPPPPRPAGSAPAPPTATPPRAPAPAVQQRPGTSNAAQPARPAPGTQATTPGPARRKAAPAAAGAAAGAAATAGAGALGATRAPEPAPPPRPAAGSATGLPLPRFAALGSNQVNLRIGPDLRYRIEWTYQRKDLPVQIVEEHQLWRRIRDPEGTEGWVQRPLLTSRRTFLVQGAERVLRQRPEEGADPVARLKPGVIGAIRKCEAASAWCEARVGDHRGWIRRSEVWGVATDEAVN